MRDDAGFAVRVHSGAVFPQTVRATAAGRHVHPMQIRCPHCQCTATLPDDSPRDAEGGVACPACGQGIVAPVDRVAAMEAAASRAQGDLFATRARPSVPGAVPRFARERVRKALPGQGRWWLASAGLALSLLLIAPIADRNELAADANWRPTMQSLCRLIGCTLPPWRESGAFQVTAREFNPHPSVKGAVLVTASFRNGAVFAQAWPLLEVTAQDVNGRVIGKRRFQPSQYLGGAPAAPELQSGQSANATLEIVADPAAVTWGIDFR